MYKPRLKKKFEEEIIPEMMKEFLYKNRMQVPKFNKIIVNIGVGSAVQNPNDIEVAINSLKAITGQMPIITKAKKSIAGFKLRAGMKIGCKVTLRGNRMYEFLDRLLSIALPRTRDFRGISPKSMDGKGNLTIGVDEQLIFPEVDPDKIRKTMGMDVTIVTTTNNNDEGFSLLKSFGVPFREK
ncbi:MAG: 50S ribosomal protein L5 [Actinomycetia bacterium]|nr:50S ribosomal protein L5 [Actinomycetes bacterium]